MTLLKDKQYYFDDGNCIFRVDDHLFKIHRFLLTESPIFEGMFALPQKANRDDMGDTEKGYEGNSDDNPIVCQDSVTSFQALCWGLYLRPLEVRKQEDPTNVNVDQLMSLALVAHKYDFVSLEEWAVVILREHWMGLSPQVAENPPKWTWDMVTQLMNFSTKTDTIDQEFKTAIESHWLSLFVRLIVDPSNIRRALDAVDEFSFHKAYGLAYYYVLRRFNMFRLPPALDTRIPLSKTGPATYQDPKNSTGMVAEVSYDQRVKLMHGLWYLISLQGVCSLGRVWFDCTCPHRVGQSFKLQKEGWPLLSDNHLRRINSRAWNSSCRSTWEAMTIAIGSRSLDFGATLEEALYQLEYSTAGTVIKRSCKQRLVTELQNLLSCFKENLVDYFTLP